MQQRSSGVDPESSLGWLLAPLKVETFLTEIWGQSHYHVSRSSPEYFDTLFGGTVAHGFLVLSLLSAFYADAVPPLKDAKVGINSGFNRVRFVSPVKTGCRIRARFVLAEIEEQNPDHWRTLLEVTVEIDGMSKPAMVAEWLTLWIV